LLKCGDKDSCKKCVKAYQSQKDEHWLSSTNKEMGNIKALMKCLQDEQRNTSALLKYLDVLRNRLVLALDQKITNAKEKIEETARRYNYKVQGLYARLKNAEEGQYEAGEAEEEFRNMQTSREPISVVCVRERRFMESLEEVIEVHCAEIGERQAPSITPNEFLADFVDSTVVKMVNVVNPSQSLTGRVEGDYRLYPNSRYCFVNDHQLVATGGEMSGYPILNSYIIDFQTGTHGAAQSHTLPYLNNARSEHATCLFSLRSSYLIYVFGTSKLIEYMQSDTKVWNLAAPEFSNGQGHAAALEWRRARSELPCILKPAACVSHLGFIYITGSSMDPPCVIYGFSPEMDLEPDQLAITPYPISLFAMRTPCVMACWHTLIVILYRENNLITGLKWSIGNNAIENEPKISIKYDGNKLEEVQFAPLCPAITRDSNCYVLTETRSRTYLLRFNFIKKDLVVVEGE
jgi:hypothetical protein